GLLAWMRNSAGFNADKAHSPLRLELDDGPLTNLFLLWETFAMMRHLNKPVELFVIPDIAHGTHELQRPDQRFASCQGTVDWMCFWLKGEERVAPITVAGETAEKLAAQYKRWRRLRELHQADLEKWEAEKRAAGDSSQR